MQPKISPSHPASHFHRGVAAVEFAFVIVILLLVLAGMVEFGRTFWYADALTKATRDGARMMSSWPVATMSQGPGTARTLVKNSANAANVNPQLALGNVLVECLDADFGGSGVCTDGAAPANVRVSITLFSVTLGDWFPFIGKDGLISYGGIPLAPHTTMRYMK